MDTNVEVKWTEMKIYEDLLNFVETGEISVPAEEMTAFCKRKIAVLNNKKVKAKERAEKNKAGTDALAEAIYNVLTDEYETVADIAAKVDFEDVTVSKCVYRLSKMVDAGKVEKTDIEVSGGEGKKTRTVKGYRKVMVDKMPSDSVEE